MDLHQFVHSLKVDRKLFSQKQLTVIENIYIYINNGCVYRVVINIVPEMIKKARRLGINNEQNHNYCQN